jgi:GNAT superfamily N-acetyltransferase
MAAIHIETWTPEHPRWADLIVCAAGENQQREVEIVFEFHIGTRVFVALAGDTIVGFLRFALQEIGPGDDCPPLMMDGEALIEAKILAFGVPKLYRRQGIGTQLQRAAIDHARELGCYQVRSWSLIDKTANYALKLKLGFAAQPEQRANSQQGFYFVMPLR